ncbi:MAG: regulatory protein RecX [Dehalococcoidia bacterium]|nr:regulatory protein RecX [Dehalococcoidia bacterium]
MEDGRRIRAVRRARRGHGVILVLEDGSELNCSDEARVAAGLCAGQAVTDDLLAVLMEADERAAVHEAALRLLERRPRTALEIQRRLGRRGVSEEAATGEIDRLRHAGLIDDERFAAAWVEERARLTPRSQRLLRAELRQHGVSAETAEAATAAVDDEEAALVLARRKAAGGRWGDERTFAARVGGFLERRGFGYDVAARAVRTAWRERERADSTGHRGE